MQDLKYEFNIHSGNLTRRKSTLYPPFGNHTLTEDFTYDESGLNNRLLTWQVSGGTQYSNVYFDNGNIDTKIGVGTYLYGTTDAGPHAVSRVKPADASYLAMAKTNKQLLTYTGFDRTSTIWQGDPAHPELANTLEITYGPGQTRKQTKYYRAGTLQQTKIFVDGTYEIEEDANGHLRHLHYLSGGDGLFAIYETDQDGKATMNYIHKDYQGSFETITNNQGTVVEKLSYDPWGRRRNPTNWTFTNVPESYKFDRGYTGHEHLDQFGLINMNGRMYDPMLGRFLSPDNYVQAPDYTQNFNRYSYVLNNPLKYTDPSGEWIHIVIGAIIGGVFNWLTHGAQFNAAGLGYFGVGALAGALAAGIGAGVGTLAAGSGSFGFSVSAGLSASGFGAGAAVGAAAGLTSGFLSGTGNSLIAGNNIGQSLNAGLQDGVKQGIIGGVMGGIGGGIRASRNGGNFWTGRSKLMPVENNRSMVDAPEISYNWGNSRNSIRSIPISSRTGGYIEQDKLYNYMVEQAKTGYSEIAVAEIQQGNIGAPRYYLLPWDKNTCTRSKIYINPNGKLSLEGLETWDVKSIYHTHPSGNPLSSLDKEFSDFFNIPVFSIGPGGNSYYYIGGNQQQIDLSLFFSF